MANTFKNAVLTTIGSTITPVYVSAVPAVTVIGATISNRTASNILVSLLVEDTSAGQTAYVVKDALVPPGANIVPIGGEQKVVLELGDRIVAQSSAASSADVILSVLEIS